MSWVSQERARAWPCNKAREGSLAALLPSTYLLEMGSFMTTASITSPKSMKCFRSFSVVGP